MARASSAVARVGSGPMSLLRVLSRLLVLLTVRMLGPRSASAAPCADRAGLRATWQEQEQEQHQAGAVRVITRTCSNGL